MERGKREGPVLAAERYLAGSHLGFHWVVVALFVMFVCLFACRRVGRGKGGKEGRGRREGAVLAAEGQFSGFHLGLHRLVVCLFVMFVCLFVCLYVGGWSGEREERGPCIWQASTWASIGQ